MNVDDYTRINKARYKMITDLKLLDSVTKTKLYLIYSDYENTNTLLNKKLHSFQISVSAYKVLHRNAFSKMVIKRDNLDNSYHKKYRKIRDRFDKVEDIELEQLNKIKTSTNRKGEIT